MKSLSSDYLNKLATDIFTALGVPEAEAEIVADHLVLANLVGFDSHGVIRIPQYVHDIREGHIVPGAPLKTSRETATTAIVDAQWNFGQVGALRAAELAIAKAKQYALGSVVLRHTRHVGMLSRYTLLAAEHDCIGLAMCGGGKEGHRVSPFGGREGRLPPNPIAFSAPTSSYPILMDFSTSMAAEGKVRLLLNRGQQLHDACLVNARGRPSTEPKDLYGPPPGAILPFGGSQGYKGFGLAIMAQVLSSLLGDPVWQSDGRDAMANSMWLLVINIESFMPAERFRQEIDQLAGYCKSAQLAEGFEEIQMPGDMNFREMEKRKTDGIPVDAETWQQITEVTKELGVQI